VVADLIEYTTRRNMLLVAINSNTTLRVVHFQTTAELMLLSTYFVC